MKDAPMGGFASENALTRRREANEGNAGANVLDVEELSAIVVDTAFGLHRDLGPGLLESVYEAVLAKFLQNRGLNVARQVPVPIEFNGVRLHEGFRAELLIQGRLLIELKSVEHLAPVHSKQLLTHLRLMRLPLGLLINCGAATFKEGIKRIVNQHHDLASSRLRVNRSAPTRGHFNPPPCHHDTSA